VAAKAESGGNTAAQKIPRTMEQKITFKLVKPVVGLKLKKHVAVAIILLGRVKSMGSPVGKIWLSS
jgi:hypothetical protein